MRLNKFAVADFAKKVRHHSYCPGNFAQFFRIAKLLVTTFVTILHQK